MIYHADIKRTSYQTISITRVIITMNNSCKTALLVITVLVIGLGAGVLICYLATRNASSKQHGDTKVTVQADNLDMDRDIRRYINEEIKAENIRSHSKTITSTPHLAGTKEEENTAKLIAEHFKTSGLEDVRLLPYNVVLSIPDKDNPNSVTLLDNSNNVLHEVETKEKILEGDPTANTGNIVPPFNAFTASGTAKGILIYVNYGRREDFEYLKLNDLKTQGRICIARYGMIFRGDKAHFAEIADCVGLLMYTDPKDYSQDENGKSYPKNWWMPRSGVQRGSLDLGHDSLTPGYAGIDGAYFEKDIDLNDIIKKDLPKIPVHPISFADAKELMRNMQGKDAPESWRGSLDIDYKIGGVYSNVANEVKMTITTEIKIAKTNNVVGIIKGEVEPDRYVMIGNHYDAWVYGAVDPTTGLSSMMEVARVLGQMKKNKGWKPRRSILFLAWGAEESGIIGSREFVEQYMTKLNSRAVAYLNMDVAVQGKFSFKAKAMPMLYKVVKDATKRVDNPDEEEIKLGRKTVYDTWQLAQPGIGLLGSGSDYTHFVSKVGVSSIDFRYTFDNSKNLSSYPLYHSAYETFYLVDTIMDPGFKLHRCVSRVLGQMVYSLSNSAILPMDIRDYGNKVVEQLKKLFKTHFYITNVTHPKELKNIIDAGNEFKKACDNFHSFLSKIDVNSELQVRMANDVLLQVERNFIDPLGLPNRKYTRNVLFAPSSSNKYAGQMFPGIVDAYYGIESFRTFSKKNARKIRKWNSILKQMSIVRGFLLSAVDLLNSHGTF